ncbi:MAG: class I SAM-dependent methyltransferase [Fibrobacter sp.]|nr:class I SAM-dependent methyltransferase [Fibrobacter sp.]
MGTLIGKSSFFKPGPPEEPGHAYVPIVEFLMRECRGKDILDIGGGRGAYSFELKKAGYAPLVVDINSSALEDARRSGLATREVSPTEILEDKSADTVVMIEVLEHVEDPKAFLQKAIRYARKRVLFTLPCTEGFEELFRLNLTYAHIAVSDHLSHYSQKEMVSLLDSLHVKYKLSLGDFVFPYASIVMLRESFKCKILGKLVTLGIRVLNRMGFIEKRIPARFYGIIEVE